MKKKDIELSNLYNYAVLICFFCCPSLIIIGVPRPSTSHTKYGICSPVCSTKILWSDTIASHNQMHVTMYIILALFMVTYQSANSCRKFICTSEGSSEDTRKRVHFLCGAKISNIQDTWTQEFFSWSCILICHEIDRSTFHFILISSRT